MKPRHDRSFNAFNSVFVWRPLLDKIHRRTYAVLSPKSFRSKRIVLRVCDGRAKSVIRQSSTGSIEISTLSPP